MPAPNKIVIYKHNFNSSEVEINGKFYAQCDHCDQWARETDINPEGNYQLCEHCQWDGNKQNPAPRWESIGQIVDDLLTEVPKA